MFHPHSYTAQKPDDSTTISLILSNAKALYTKTYPTASRFDLVTSCRTLTGRLDSMGHSAALIVCFSDGKWETIHRSNLCATVDDALFEVMYWVGEEVDEVLDETQVLGKRRRRTQDGDEGGGKKMKQMMNETVKRKQAGESLLSETSKKIREDAEMTD
jgi:hypothetical protein